MTRTRWLRGYDGVDVPIAERGTPGSPTVVFIHGFSMSAAVWRKQFAGLPELRLVAYHLRGHGTAKHPGAPVTGEMFAQDLDVVLRHVGGPPPVVCAWSYGGLVLCDYLRNFGTDAIAAVNLVGTTCQRDATPPTWPHSTKEEPGYLSRDPERARLGIESLVAACTWEPLGIGESDELISQALQTPVEVRRALFERVVDNRDVLATLDRPTLVTFGSQDPSAARAGEVAELVPGAVTSVYLGVGHMPFWEAVERFNAELEALAARAIG